MRTKLGVGDRRVREQPMKFKERTAGYSVLTGLFQRRFSPSPDPPAFTYWEVATTSFRSLFLRERPLTGHNAQLLWCFKRQTCEEGSNGV